MWCASDVMRAASAVGVGAGRHGCNRMFCCCVHAYVLWAVRLLCALCVCALCVGCAPCVLVVGVMCCECCELGVVSIVFCLRGEPPVVSAVIGVVYCDASACYMSCFCL